MSIISEIDSLLEFISRSINWVSTSRNILSNEDRLSMYATLTHSRRELKRIRRAASVNPATVVFGESQKGKSYLVTALLGENQQPFYVVDEDLNKTYNFKTEINPIGGGIESTGLVTRFTTSQVSNITGFPVKIKMLTVLDLILVLCDSYFSDLKDQQYERISDIKDFLIRLEETYKGTEPISSPLLDEDDVMEMGRYMDSHFHGFASHLTANEVQFFERVSRLINRIPIDEYVKLFSYIWYNNSFYKELFDLLLKQYSVIGFAKEVYVNYSALLRDGSAILDVERLKSIYNTSEGKNVELRYYVGQGVRTASIERNFLSALAAEAVCQIPKSLVKTKPFLDVSDILDFPGWRRRESIVESALNKEVMPELLLRGKVAYFFYNYSENKMISSLLLCHDREQTAQSEMPNLIEDWLRNVMCTQAFKLAPDGQERNRILKEDRSKFLQISQVPPLFVVMTKFNLDLKFDAQNDKASSDETLRKRWDDRFNQVLGRELLKTDIHHWFDDWSAASPSFNNIYLLRDFFFSSEEENGIFRGWTQEGGREQAEIPVQQFPDFRAKLKQTFLEHEFVRSHFANPEESWNAAATVGHDGTELIVDRLGCASSNICKAIQTTFNTEVSNIKKTIYCILDSHCIKPDAEDNYRKAVRKATELSLDFRFAFVANRTLFGFLMDKLLLNPVETYNIIHFANHANAIVNNTGLGLYGTLYNQYRDIVDSKQSFDDKLNALSHRGWAGNKDQCKTYFKSRGIDLGQLLTMKPTPPLTAADILGDSICSAWIKQIQNVSVVSEQIDSSDVSELISLYVKMFERLKIKDKIVSEIRPFVNNFNNSNESMVSDICTEILNKFVLNVGSDSYSNEIKKHLRSVSERQPDLISLPFDTNSDRRPVSNQDICDILVSIDSPTINGGYVPGEKCCEEWLNSVKMGIVSTSDIPDYNVEDNESLRLILDLINPQKTE